MPDHNLQAIVYLLIEMVGRDMSVIYAWRFYRTNKDRQTDRQTDRKTQGGMEQIRACPSKLVDRQPPKAKQGFTLGCTECWDVGRASRPPNMNSEFGQVGQR